MHLLYVIGRGSRHDNQELRWSLRAVAKYAKNVTRVVVAGYPPDWLSDEVVKVPVEDVPGAKYKHVNILNAVLTAIDQKAVEGDFLYSSDDHFLCGPMDFDKFPVLRRSGDLPLFKEGEDVGTHKRSLENTRKLLQAAGLAIMQWWTHANTHMNANDAPRVRELVKLGEELGYGRLGYEPTCLFMAVRADREYVPITARVGGDIKLGNEFRLPQKGALPMFSISDKAFKNADFLAYMNREFGAPCRYEKGGETAAPVEASDAAPAEEPPVLTQEQLDMFRPLNAPMPGGPRPDGFPVDVVMSICFTGYRDRYFRMMDEMDRMGLTQWAHMVWTFPTPYDAWERSRLPHTAVLDNREGMWSTCKGHYRALKTAYELGHQAVLILEDDCRFLKDADAVRDALAKAPANWDILMLDHGYLNDAGLPQGPWVPCRSITMSSACYMVSRKAMERLIRMYESAVKGNYRHPLLRAPDAWINRQYLGDDVHLYGAVPNLAIQCDTKGVSVCGRNHCEPTYCDLNVKVADYAEF